MRVGHVAPGSTIREGGGPQPLSASRKIERSFFFTAQTFHQQLCLVAHEMPAWGDGAHRGGIPSRSTRPVEPSPARERCGETRTRSRAYSKVRDTRLAPPLARVSLHSRVSARFDRDLTGDPEARPPRRAAREPRESSPDIFAIRRVDTLRGRAGAGKRPAATPRASHGCARRGTVL